MCGIHCSLFLLVDVTCVFLRASVANCARTSLSLASTTTCHLHIPPPQSSGTFGPRVLVNIIHAASGSIWCSLAAFIVLATPTLLAHTHTVTKIAKHIQLRRRGR
jgi:hypothetical protein